MTNFTTTLFFTYLYANQNHHTLKAKKPKLYHRASSYHYFHFASYFIHSSSTHLFHQSLAQCTKPNPSVNLNCTIKIEQTDRPTHNLQIISVDKIHEKHFIITYQEMNSVRLDRRALIITCT